MSENSIWFSGNAFDNLGEKDLLVQIFQDLDVCDITPPSVQIPWDAIDTTNVIAPGTVASAKLDKTLVLKPPLGCQGNGIEFVNTVEEALPFIMRDAENAIAEKGFIESIRRLKGRIPSWVLQAHVPSMLIDKGRKFHLRAYIVVDQRNEDVFYYDEFEVRVASKPLGERPYSDRSAHITNGAGGDETSRQTFTETKDLLRHRNGVVTFLEKMFEGRIREELFRKNDNCESGLFRPTKEYALAALDIMIDNHFQPWLLEVNARSPGCPEQGLGSEAFQRHLVSFAAEIIQLATTGDSPRFHSIEHKSPELAEHPTSVSAPAL
eukprot:CAMPEP_0203744212 /NCGR_PEP_ID=MMETSP0098-20131031/363_1 /ASSEMBLY_ACC=CAM_ASM_000208 /TAXON_ID=96639 /ORGANISM=" , Strain NY0313808BC1" /LENGTH=321 /DNA_ID=CAMNT_0050631673 /DNA_START=366 /DNA_END=1331 /DNA_ORIENTATION=-